MITASFWMALVACSSNEPAPVVTSPPAPATEPVTIRPLPKRPVQETNHATAVANQQQLIALNDKRYTSPKVSWPTLVERMERMYTMHRLSGRTEHLDAGTDAIEQAWAKWPEEPKVRRARADALQKGHDFPGALTMLEGLEGPADQAARAQLNFELGNYADSVAILEKLAAEGKPFPSPGILAQLAACQWKLGRFDDAERSIRLAQTHWHGTQKFVDAWHHLMLGLMDLDRKRLDDAMAHYQDAERAFPGWWLIQEHIAEIHLTQGRPEVALPIYERVVEATGNPELMAGLADTLDALGRADDAKTMRERADTTFRTRLATHPKEAGGHALEYFLEHGSPEEALALAERNVALRPNGDAKLLLAQAFEKNGQAAKATALREEVRQSGWFIPPE